MTTYRTPGVHRESVPVKRAVSDETGIPAILGVTGAQADAPRPISRWAAFLEEYPALPPDGFLASAVRGFFANGGRRCHIIALRDASLQALRQGLTVLATFVEADLVVAPDIALAAQQKAGAETVGLMRRAVVDACDQLGDRFAILDADRHDPLPRGGVVGTNAAVYFPWVQVDDGPPSTGGYVPPSGHVAGIYARSDARVGVHKVPANEVVDGVMDVEILVDERLQAELNPGGVNCIRAFPGRGIRVWGGRTVSDEPAWRYVGVRRLFIDVGRWIERSLTGIVFEPNDSRLWARLERELDAHFAQLLQAGALRGSSPDEAYYVRCNEETNPPAVRDAGKVVTEIGLAPSNPNEFVIVRVTHGASGIEISGPLRPTTTEG